MGTHTIPRGRHVTYVPLWPTSLTNSWHAWSITSGWHVLTSPKTSFLLLKTLNPKHRKRNKETAHCLKDLKFHMSREMEMKAASGIDYHVNAAWRPPVTWVTQYSMSTYIGTGCIHNSLSPYFMLVPHGDSRGQNIQPVHILCRHVRQYFLFLISAV